MSSMMIFSVVHSSTMTKKEIKCKDGIELEVDRQEFAKLLDNCQTQSLLSLDKRH